MKLIYWSYRWAWHTIYPNLRGAYYDIFNGIKNLFTWFPIVWHDRDWDWVFLLEVMEFKFRRMSELHKKYGHLKRSDRTAKELLICAELCRKLREDEIGMYYYDIAEREKKPISWRKAMWKREENINKQHLELLGKMIARHLRTWWD